MGIKRTDFKNLVLKNALKVLKGAWGKLFQKFFPKKIPRKIDNQAFLRYNNRMSEMNRRPENEFEQLKGFEEDARGFAEGD